MFSIFKKKNPALANNTVLEVRGHYAANHLATIEQNEVVIQANGTSIIQPEALCGSTNWSVRNKDTYERFIYDANNGNGICSQCKVAAEAL